MNKKRRKNNNKIVKDEKFCWEMMKRKQKQKKMRKEKMKKNWEGWFKNENGKGKRLKGFTETLWY